MVQGTQLVNLTNSRVPKETSLPRGSLLFPCFWKKERVELQRGLLATRTHLVWGYRLVNLQERRGKMVSLSAQEVREENAQGPEREMLSDGTFEALRMLLGAVRELNTERKRQG